MIGKYVIVRTYSAGVHFGIAKKIKGTNVTLKKSRRLWEWRGAFTCSGLAKTGPTKPEQCKFSCENKKILLTQAIEVIPCTEKAIEVIIGVKEHGI